MSRTNVHLRTYALCAAGLLILGGALPANAQPSDVEAETVSAVVDKETLVHLPPAVADALVVTIERDVAEDVISAIATNGDPFEIVVQRSPVEDLGASLPINAPPIDPSAHTTTAPGPWTGVLEAQPVPESSWRISAVTVTGTSSVGLYWPSVGSFSATISETSSASRAAGEAAPEESASSDQSVQLAGLEADNEYLIVAAATDGSETRYIQARTLPEGDAAGNRLANPLRYQPLYQTYSHRTFIVENRIDVGLRCPDQSGYTFGGDNRGYYPPDINDDVSDPRSYRTMMRAQINWNSPTPYFDLAKNVGQTRVYNASGGLHAAAYTSMAGMTFGSAYATSSYARVLLHHEANDPLCTVFWGGVNHAPPIYYDEWVQFYRSGTTQVAGVRQPAPNHEMYAKFTSPTGEGKYWRPVAQLPNEGFDCLVVLACPAEEYDISVDE